MPEWLFPQAASLSPVFCIKPFALLADDLGRCPLPTEHFVHSTGAFREKRLPRSTTSAPGSTLPSGWMLSNVWLAGANFALTRAQIRRTPLATSKAKALRRTQRRRTRRSAASYSERGAGAHRLLWRALGPTHSGWARELFRRRLTWHRAPSDRSGGCAARPICTLHSALCTAGTCTRTRATW